MNIALDIDGTISRCPALFAVLCEGVRKKGGRIWVITSRAATPEVEQATRRELEAYGIRFDELVIISDDRKRQIPCPHEELDWYQKYLWQKVRICLDRKVDVAFEDDGKVIELFQRYAPGIQVIQVR